MTEADDLDRAELEAAIAYEMWNRMGELVREKQERLRELREAERRAEARALREARRLGIQVVGRAS